MTSDVAEDGKPVHVVLAGGGTAGHIEPALALADALRRVDPTIGITALGTTKGLESRLVPERGYPLRLIPAVPLPRRPTPELISVPARLAGTVRRTAEILEEVGADIVVGFGGYVALPAYLAARRRATPILVHEANLRPGVANRIGARLTTHVATAHARAKLPHAVHIGMPLREAITTLDRHALRADARATFGLDPDRPTLLVSGGSSGARRLNETALAAADRLLAAGVQVLHAVGPRNEVVTPAHEGGAPYVTVPYLDRMDLAYAAADFMLARGGAMTCAELAAVGLPACYVPLPIGNGEQRLNAQPVVAAGGGLLVDDADLTADWLCEHVLPVLRDAERLRAMELAAASAGPRDADRVLAGMVLDIIGTAGGSEQPAAGRASGIGADAVAAPVAAVAERADGQESGR